MIFWLLTASALTQGCQSFVLTSHQSIASDGDTSACGQYLTKPKVELDGEQKGFDGGEWSPCTHLSVYGINFAPFVGRFLAYQLAPKTALEFGCGLGTMSDYVARFADASVTCIEPEETLGELIMSLRSDMPGKGKLEQLALNVFSEEPQAQQCVQSGALKKDLVYSFEVAEHIPAQYRDSLVDLLVNSTGKWLVFSAARPDQVGTGHIPESMLTGEQWRDIFEKRGLVYMPQLTMMARKAAYPARNYDLHGNILVFKHPSNPVQDTAVPHDMLASFRGTWWGDAISPASNTQERYDRISAFDAGSNAALWPGLTLKEAQVRSGKYCKEPVGLLQGNMSVARSEAFTSAYAAHYYAKQQLQ